jgi:hypothetical protein
MERCEKIKVFFNSFLRNLLYNVKTKFLFKLHPFTPHLIDCSTGTFFWKWDLGFDFDLKLKKNTYFHTLFNPF